jgi:hypothetical protein
MAGANALGVTPADVAGIFRRNPDKTSMTEAEFKQAYEEWSNG